MGYNQITMISRIFKKTKRILPFFDTRIHLSFGENCLTDNILSRNGIKSFSTPFSHGRSNIDYILDLEKNRYKGLLDKKNLEYQKLEDNKNETVRSIRYNKCSNIYHDLHSLGFEFTHHDVINNIKHKNSLDRKIERLLQIRKKEDICIYYHYRYSINNNLTALASKLKELTRIYQGRLNRVKVYIIKQELVKNEIHRKVDIDWVDKNICVLKFFTSEAWEGHEGQEDLFWAKPDDDLIEPVFQKIKTNKL